MSLSNEPPACNRFVVTLSFVGNSLGDPLLGRTHGLKNADLDQRFVTCVSPDYPRCKVEELYNLNNNIHLLFDNVFLKMPNNSLSQTLATLPILNLYKFANFI